MTYEEVVKEAQKIVAKGDASGIKDHLLKAKYPSEESTLRDAGCFFDRY